MVGDGCDTTSVMPVASECRGVLIARGEIPAEVDDDVTSFDRWGIAGQTRSRDSPNDQR
jgi:hypothetical protein